MCDNLCDILRQCFTRTTSCIFYMLSANIDMVFITGCFEREHSVFCYEYCVASSSVRIWKNDKKVKCEFIFQTNRLRHSFPKGRMNQPDSGAPGGQMCASFSSPPHTAPLHSPRRRPACVHCEPTSPPSLPLPLLCVEATLHGLTIGRRFHFKDAIFKRADLSDIREMRTLLSTSPI